MATEVFNIRINQSGAGRAAASVRRLGRASAAAARSIGLLGAALLGLGAGIGVRAIAGTIDSFIDMENRIRLVDGSTEKAGKAMSGLLTIANETRQPIETTSELYRRMAINSRQLGLSQEQLLGVLRAVNQAVAISGATAQEARAGIIQLSQGLASGQLRGEEFRSVAEQLPRLLIAIADGTGLSIGALRELAFQGKISGKLVVEALASQSEILNEEFTKVQPTIEQIGVVFKNNFTVAIGLIAKASGLMNFLNNSLFNTAKNSGPAMVGAFASMQEGIAGVLTGGADLLLFMSELGIEVVSLGRAATAVFGALELSLRAVGVGVNFFRKNTARTDLSIAKRKFARIPNPSNEEIQEIKELEKKLADVNKDLQRSSNGIVAASDKIFDALTDPKKLTDLKETAETWKTLGETLKTNSGRLRELAKIVFTPGDVPIPEGEVSDQSNQETLNAARARENALKRIVSLTNQISREAAKGIDPLEGQLEKLKQQRAELIKLGTTAGDLKRVKTGLLLLDQQEADILQTQKNLTLDNALLFAEIDRLVKEIAKTSPEFADELERAAFAARDSGEGLEKTNDELKRLVESGGATAQREQERAGVLGEEVGKKLGGFIASALRGEAVDFAQTFGDIASEIFERNFTKLFEDLGSQLQKALSSTSFGQKLGGNLGNAVGAAIGIGGLLLSNLLKDTTSEIQNDLATDSIITDTRAVRGVVAGDTSIPIFQLGEELESANDRVVDVLEEILDAIRGGSSLGGSVTAESEADILVAGTTPSLF